MRFEKIDHIPAKVPTRYKKDTYEMLDRFVKSDANFARVILDPGDYTRLESARQSLKESCQRHNLPVRVITRDGELYLSRQED